MIIKKGDRVYHKSWLNKSGMEVLSADDTGLVLEEIIIHGEYCGCNKGAYVERYAQRYDFNNYSRDGWRVEDPTEYYIKPR